MKCLHPRCFNADNILAYTLLLTRQFFKMKKKDNSHSMLSLPAWSSTSSRYFLFTKLKIRPKLINLIKSDLIGNCAMSWMKSSSNVMKGGRNIERGVFEVERPTVKVIWVNNLCVKIFLMIWSHSFWNKYYTDQNHHITYELLEIGRKSWLQQIHYCRCIRTKF